MLLAVEGLWAFWDIFKKTPRKAAHLLFVPQIQLLDLLKIQDGCWFNYIPILGHYWETADRKSDTLILRHFLNPTPLVFFHLPNACRIFFTYFTSGSCRTPAEYFLRFYFRFPVRVMSIRHCPNSIRHYYSLIIISIQRNLINFLCVDFMLMTSNNIHLP